MAKRMLIDASHPAETRVVVISGNRLQEFDYETSSKKQLKGNIYLAKVTRVEPSLQAAFVEYGGNRHGFLPFSEIHPDYYRIPIADREALLAAEAELKTESAEVDLLDEAGVEPAEAPAEPETGEPGATSAEARAEGTPPEAEAAGQVEELAADTGVDTVGGDEIEDAARRRAKLLRRYKIQEVIKRRQVMLVQVTKEERGTKGAALTTYLSLAGRYCVLMPNTAKGGGISRKISSAKDRRRLKQIVEGLEIPEGVAVIVRTAGSERTKAEIRRDYEYLLRLWSEIRSTTLASTAPCLIYEEANLIKRAMRDLYESDMDEILVEGDEGYKVAKAFMKSLTPSHARKVKQYKDPAIPLFYRHQVEGQIDAMHNATVQLKSGGYIVINMTEALVAIDVNSGKATRERHIEETAYKTNLEAADEVTRQLRLRDLAGLIVIDFIDMEESRHNRGVERKLKEAMRGDRARIQLGRISPFGLLEMSRQRLRPSLFESSTEVCPQCNATGYVRTTESVALHVLRGLEEEGIRRRGGTVSVSVPTAVALHVLNRMRDRLAEIELRYGFRVRVETDDALLPPNYRLEHADAAPAAKPVEAEEERPAAEAEKAERKRGRARRRRRKGEPPAAAAETAVERPEAEEPEQEPEEVAAEPGAEVGEEVGEEKPKRRRRGKRGGRRRSRRPKDEAAAGAGEPEGAETEEVAAGEPEGAETEEVAAAEPEGVEAEEVAVVEPEGAEIEEVAAAEPEGAETEEVAAAEPEPAIAAAEGADTGAADVADAAERPWLELAGPAPSDAGAAAEPVAAPRPEPAAPKAAPRRRSAKKTAAEAEPAGAGPVGETAVHDNGAEAGFERPGAPQAEHQKRRGWWQRWG